MVLIVAVPIIIDRNKFQMSRSWPKTTPIHDSNTGPKTTPTNHGPREKQSDKEQRSLHAKTPRRTQNRPSRTVQAPERGIGENPKSNFTQLQDLPITVTREEKMLNGCLKSTTTGHHMQNQSRRLKRRNTHVFLLKRQPPACQRILVATKDRSGWTQCQAEKTRDIEQTTRGQDNKKKRNKDRSNPSKRTTMRGTAT